MRRSSAPVVTAPSDADVLQARVVRLEPLEEGGSRLPLAGVVQGSPSPLFPGGLPLSGPVRDRLGVMSFPARSS